MKFSTYLKTCREQNRLTQEELVRNLYSYDIGMFEGLDTSTLSKWERGITQPKTGKQVSLLKFFQKKTATAFPCWSSPSVEEAEDLICQKGIKNLLGKTKQLILNFPSKMMHHDNLKVYPLKHFERMDALLNINMDIHQNINHPFTQISLEQFKTWALHPSNLFLACEYKDEFVGLFFSLRLKPEIFDKLMNFEMKKSDIQTEDFASFDEMGSNYLLSFYALNEKAGTMLGIRYYAHLIAHHSCIQDLGVITVLSDVERLVHYMDLEKYKTKLMHDHIKLKSYKQTLSNILVSKNVVKMLFSKDQESCE